MERPRRVARPAAGCASPLVLIALALTAIFTSVQTAVLFTAPLGDIDPVASHTARMAPATMPRGGGVGAQVAAAAAPTTPALRRPLPSAIEARTVIDEELVLAASPSVAASAAAAAPLRLGRREVVVYRRPNEAHKTGGPAGEQVLFRSLIAGLRNCSDVRLTVSEDARAIAGVLRDLGARLHMLFIDQYALDDVLPMRRSDMALWRGTVACRLRLIDYWGTPPPQNWWSLHMHQFLVPFENGYNYRLGFFVAEDGAPAAAREGATRKAQGIVWGKEQKYFRRHAAALRALASSGIRLVATVDAQRMLPGGGDATMRDLFRDSIDNVGHLSQEGWHALLHESAFVLGLGDPVIGPTPVEALAAGCAYLNPVYPAPRQLGQNARVKLRTQHDPLAAVGPPAVLDVQLRGGSAATSWMFDEADLVAKAAGAVKEWQSAPRAPKAWLPEAFRFAAFMLQLRAVLASNFEEHCTARCSGFIKPKGTTTCPPPGGGGD